MPAAYHSQRVLYCIWYHSGEMFKWTTSAKFIYFLMGHKIEKPEDEPCKSRVISIQNNFFKLFAFVTLEQVPLCIPVSL